MQVYTYEVWDDDTDCLTRVRVLEDNTLEVELNNPYNSSVSNLTPKEAREFARDLMAAAKVATTK